MRKRHWEPGFLEALSETANVSRSARAVNICLSTAYALRKRSATFAAGWENALEWAQGEALNVAYQRTAGDISRASDRLLACIIGTGKPRGIPKQPMSKAKSEEHGEDILRKFTEWHNRQRANKPAI